MIQHHVFTRKFHQLIWLLLIFFSINVSVYSQDNNKIRIGYANSKNLYFDTETKMPCGYSYEYLLEVAQYTNWKYEFINDTWENLLVMLKNGQIDILNGVESSPNWGVDLSYSEIPTGTTPLGFFILNDTNPEKIIKLFRDKTYNKIGTVKGRSQTDIYKYMNSLNNTNFKIVEYNSSKELTEALIKKEIDSAFTTNMYATKEQKILVYFTDISYYYAVKKGNTKILNDLNSAMNKINLIDPFFKMRLYSKYFRNSSYFYPVLTDAEQQYISQKKSIKIAVEPEFYPVSYLDKNKKFSGIVADILDLVCSYCGLKYEIVNINSLEEALESLNSGDIDIIPSVIHDYDRGSNNNMYLSSIYYESLIYRVFSTKKKAIEKNKIIIASRKGASAIVTKLPLYEFGSSIPSIEIFNTTKECVDAVRNNSVDYAYLDQYATLYQMSLSRNNTLSYSLVPNMTVGFSMGISKKCDPILLSIINKSLLSISESQIDEVLFKASYNKPQGEFVDYLYTNRKIFIIASIFFIILGITISILLSINFINRRQNKELKKADKAKTDFLSRISHEIRTPLNGIAGLNEIIALNIPKEGIVFDSVIKIRKSCEYLRLIIDDVLDLRKIQDNKMELINEPFILPIMIDSITTIYQTIAKENNLILNVSIKDAFLDKFNGDELRIKQIIINLVSNAIKYNKPNGIINLDVSKLPCDEKNYSLVRFSVTDTGIGILPENLDKVFQSYTREERKKDERLGGTGLGLSIAQSLANLMDSKILVESVFGEGSHFWFDLKLEITNLSNKYTNIENSLKKTSIEPAKISLEGLRILVVDDEEINSDIAEYMLHTVNAECVIAENGKKACDIFERHDSGYFNAILMDVKMPVMGGYEATQIIRKMDKLDAKSIPIVALSAGAFNEDIKLSMKAGMTVHCAKPVDWPALFTTLKVLCS